MEKAKRKTPRQYLSKHTHALLALAIVLASTLTSSAQSSGALDATFGTGGKVTTDFGGPTGSASVAVQPDGKIIAAGGAVISPYSNFALARYDSDGTLDLSFGNGGKVTTAFVTTAFGQVSAQAYSIALQQDGKIVVAGVANIDGGEDFALVRYNSNGTIDVSFGTGGKVTTDFDLVGQGFSFAFASSVAVQQDGRIVAAGDAYIDGGRDFALARYNNNGTLDASFGTGGKVNTNFSGSTFADFANSVAVQPDGKIVAAGGTMKTFVSPLCPRWWVNGCSPNLSVPGISCPDRS